MDDIKIVEKISYSNLQTICSSGVPVFDSAEFNFFSQFAPLNFPKKDLSRLLESKETRHEAAQIIFSGIVKADAVLQNPYQVETWVKENLEKLNPFFEILNLERINWDKDITNILFKTNLTGVKALDKLMVDTEYTIAKRTDLTTDARFLQVRDKVFELFGDVPAFLFGSYLTKSNTGDIDIRVFPDSISSELYSQLGDKRVYVNSCPLEFMIAQKEHMINFLLLDNWMSFRKERSVVLNGPINYPVPKDDSHFNYVRLADIALQGLRIRYSLTPQGLSECKGILKRINSRIKKPRYMHANLEEITGVKINYTPIKKFKSLPDDKSLKDAFIKTNLQLNQLINFYQKYK